MSSNSAAVQPLPPDLFRRVCGRWATGISVVTTLAADGSPHGITVNSFTSVSLKPPIISVAIDHRSQVLPLLRAATSFGVNILNEDQEAISARFAAWPEGRFEGLDWTRGVTGVPVLPDLLGIFECNIHQVVDVGDHAVFFGLVERAVCHEGRPLLYFGGGYAKLSR